MNALSFFSFFRRHFALWVICVAILLLLSMLFGVIAYSIYTEWTASGVTLENAMFSNGTFIMTVPLFISGPIVILIAFYSIIRRQIAEMMRRLTLLEIGGLSRWKIGRWTVAYFFTMVLVTDAIGWMLAYFARLFDLTAFYFLPGAAFFVVSMLILLFLLLTGRGMQEMR